MENNPLLDNKEYFIRLKSGDQDAFKRMYIDTIGLLISIVVAITKHKMLRDEVEDVVANSYCYVFENMHLWRDYHHIRSALVVHSKHRSIDWYRHHTRFVAERNDYIYRVIDEVEMPNEEMIDKGDRLQSVVDHIKKLPPRRREVLQCLLLDGMNILEVANKFGLSPQTVRNVKTKAIRMLQKKFTGKTFHTRYLFAK